MSYQTEDGLAKRKVQASTQRDGQRVEAYWHDILKYLIVKEAQEAINGDFMARQTDINGRMREILVDWLVDVASKFKLATETLFLAVAYIDRYLSVSLVARNRLQLVGVTCLYIAAKLEEIYPPPLEDFVKVADGAYTKQELIELEPEVISALNFNLTVSTSLRFFLMFTRFFSLSSKFTMMGRYICELCLTKYEMLTLSSSQVACGVAYLVGRLLNSPVEWPEGLEQATGLSLAQVRHCAKPCYLVLLAASQQPACHAVLRKYSADKYLQVALLRIDLHG